MIRLLLLKLFVVASSIPVSFADSPVRNAPKLYVDRTNSCLAHSVPDKFYGNDGKTDIFIVRDGLELLDTYNWYSSNVFITCTLVEGQLLLPPIIVMTGPWSDGHLARDDHLALGFYRDGKLIKEYSTLDIANGDTDNVDPSVSHYKVVGRYYGFSGHWDGTDLRFLLRTIDGRKLAFDAISGEIIETEQLSPCDPWGDCPD